jgi:2-polyprenyl-6-methoxyphenol hydroxylase-like FAD-dependent oxidoreductase
MFIAPQIFADGSAAKTGFGGNDIDYEPATGPLLDNTKSYVMWALSGRRQVLLPDKPVQSLGGDDLKGRVQRATAGWHKTLQDLIARTDPATVSCLPIRTSVPVDPWPTQRITLLGDAIQGMTPFRGIGANVALRDAANLHKALCAGDGGKNGLLESIQ